MITINPRWLRRFVFQPFAAANTLSWLLLLAAALGLRLVGVSKSVWMDEAFTLYETLAQPFLQAVRNSDHPMLYPLLLRGWAAFGTGEAFLRPPSVLFGVAAVWVVMRTLAPQNRLAALLVGVMAAFSPPLLRFSQEIRDYALLLLFTALAFFFASRLQSHPEKKWGYVGLAVSASGAVLTHLVGVFLLPALAVYLGCYWRRFNRRSLLALGLAFAVPILVFAGYYLFILSPEVRSRGHAQWGFPVLTPEIVLFAFLYLIGFFQWSEPLPGLLPTGGLVPTHPVSVALLIALLFLITFLLVGGFRKSAPFLLAALAYWAGMVLYSVFFAVIINERTVMPGLVPLLCFAALQLAASESPARRAITAAVVGLLCLSSALNWLTYSAVMPLDDLRALVGEITSHYQPGDKVVVYPGYAEAALAYYAPQIPAEAQLMMPVPREMTGAVTAELESSIQQQTHAARTVFLVVRADAAAQSNPHMVPYLQSLLEKQFGRPAAWQSGRLGVYRYQR